MLAYEFGPVEFDAPGGEPSVVELKLPDRGAIESIILNQIAGDPVGGVFRIFRSRAAAMSVLDTAESSSSSALPGENPNQYSVMGIKAFTTAGFEEYQKAYSYRNRDGTLSSPVRRLWLVIQPEGTGDKSFALSMTIDEELNLSA